MWFLYIHDEQVHRLASLCAQKLNRKWAFFNFRSPLHTGILNHVPFFPSLFFCVRDRDIGHGVICHGVICWKCLIWQCSHHPVIAAWTGENTKLYMPSELLERVGSVRGSDCWTSRGSHRAALHTLTKGKSLVLLVWSGSCTVRPRPRCSGFNMLVNFVVDLCLTGVCEVPEPSDTSMATVLQQKRVYTSLGTLIIQLSIYSA